MAREKTLARTGRRRWCAEWLLVACLGLGLSFGSVAAQDESTTEADLAVVASIRPLEAGDWQLVGRVIFEGSPAIDAAVWAIAADGRGNRLSPPAVRTDSLGGFTMGPIPRVIGPDSNHTVTRILVQARSELAIGADTVKVRGSQDLRITSTSWFQKPLHWLVASFVIFLVSIVVAVIYWPLRWVYVKYYFSVGLAVMFTVTTIACISFAMREVNAIGPDGEPPRLGFVNLYKGTYVPGVQAEWLVSFTAQKTLKVDDGGGESAFDEGMGAPLWVLLLSVIGAALFTLILLIEAITDRPKSGVLNRWLLMNTSMGAADKWRLSVSEKIKRLVKHQFFILFAPIGAIFIYQLLIVSEAAYNHTTVAISALAAGLTPYWLLNKALGFAGRILAGKPVDTGDDPPPEVRVGPPQTTEEPPQTGEIVAPPPNT